MLEWALEANVTGGQDACCVYLTRDPSFLRPLGSLAGVQPLTR